jgi:Type II secretion system (T2SS), protein G
MWGAGCPRTSTAIENYTNMQGISARIEELRATGALTDARAAELVSAVAGGRDQWGHPFLYRSKSSEAGLSYVLVSLGSDGKPDVKDLVDYFSMPEEDIDGHASRDIVFRDGRPIVNAGK